MRVSEELKFNADMASLYGLLARYYENDDPETHFYYNSKHFQFVRRTAELAKLQDPPPRMLGAEQQPVPAMVPWGTADIGTVPPWAAVPFAGGQDPPYPHAASAYPVMPYSAAVQSPFAPAAVSPAAYAPPAPSALLEEQPGALGMPAATAAGGMAMVRAVHAIPDAPEVDVYVNGRKLLSNVSYKATTDFITVPAGTYRVQLFPSGSTETPLLTKSLTVEPGTAYTLVAAGTTLSPDLVLYRDELSAPPGSVRLRFIHLSPDAPEVDIAPKGGRVLFPNVGFKEATRYATVAPGTYSLEVRAAGTDNVILTVPNTRLSGGKVYTILVLGLAGGTPGLEAKVLRV